MTRPLRISLLLSCAVSMLSGCAPIAQWQAFGPDVRSDTLPHLPPDGLMRSIAADDLEHSLPEPAIPAEGPISLSVEEATLLAVRRNRDLRVERYAPVIAASFEQIERGVFDPELFARVEVYEDEAVEVSRATGESFGATRTDTFGQVGVRQTLPTGTTVQLDATTSRTTSNRSPEQQESRVGLTLTQALLRGLGPAVSLAAVRQASLDTIATLYQLQGFVEALVAETETTYWNFALAAQRIRIFEESLDLAARQLDEVAQRIEVGVIARTELATAQAEVAQREQDLIDARSELQTLRLRLLRLTGAAPDGFLDRELTPSSEPFTTPAPVDDLEDRLELAVLRRPDLNEARLRLEQDRIQVVVTSNGLLPRLDFFLTLGKSGYANTFRGTWREIDGDAFDFAAGLEFSYPIGNRVAEGLHQAAIATRQQSAASVANLEQLVRLDVRLAATEVERARQQISATAVTRELREEALRAESERFRVGASTSLLVAQAQRDLLESQISEVEAVVAYRLALIDLYLAEGSLLARRGLTLEDASARSWR